jgi:hypothetical protein
VLVLLEQHTEVVAAVLRIYNLLVTLQALVAEQQDTIHQTQGQIVEQAALVVVLVALMD